MSLFRKKKTKSELDYIAELLNKASDPSASLEEQERYIYLANLKMSIVEKKQLLEDMEM